METGEFFNKDLTMIEQFGGGAVNYSSEIHYGNGFDDPSLLESEISRNDWNPRGGARSVFSKRNNASLLRGQVRSKHDKIKAGNMLEARSYIYDLPLSRHYR